MILEILLSATLEAALGLLAEAGFGDEINKLKSRLTRKEENERRKAFEKAFESACQAIDNNALDPLLNHRPFQEAIVVALLDPESGLDMDVIAQYWGERYPEYGFMLKKFFNTLQHALLFDDIWGPILERYQNLRLSQEVKDALQIRQFPQSETELVPYIFAALNELGANVQGERNKDHSDYRPVIEIVLQKIIHLGKPSDRITGVDICKEYLSELIRQANMLPWTNLSLDYADPSKGDTLRLTDVYTALDTTEMRRFESEEDLRQFLANQQEDKRISVQECLNQKSRLIILGDPGSGKSTFIKYVVFLLAQANLADDPTHWLKLLSPWEMGSLIPVWVELRQLAAFLTGFVRRGSSKLLFRFFQYSLAEQDLDDFFPELKNIIRDNGSKLIFLIDGLDEVPASQRQLIVDALYDFARQYNHHRYVITSRPYAYVGQPWQLPEFHQVTLAPFSEEQSDYFVENWYQRLTKRGRLLASDAGERVRNLRLAMRRRDLRGLAERPFCQ